MASITGLNVRLGLDASMFSDGADLARAEVNKVARTLRQSEPPAKKFQNELELLDKAFSAAGKKSKEYAQAVEFLRQKHKQITPEVSRTNAEMVRVRDTMASMVPGGNLLTATLRGPAAALAALAASAAIVARNMSQAAERIDVMAKEARKLGLLSAELQGIRLAAGELSGMATGTVDSALQAMTRRIAQAAQGSGAAADSLRQLGLNAEELNKAGPREAMMQIADAMQGVESQSDRVRMAFDIFGRSGVDMVNTLAEGRGALLAAEHAAQRLGIAMTQAQEQGVEDMNDALGRMKLAGQGLWNQLTAEAAPAVETVAGLLTELVVGVRQLFQLTTSFGDGFVFGQYVVMGKALEFATEQLQKLNTLFSVMPNMMPSLFRSDGTEAADNIAAAAVEAEMLTEQLEEARRAAEAVEQSFDKQVQSLELEQLVLEGNADIAERIKLDAQGYNAEQIDTIMHLQKQNDLIRQRIKDKEESRRLEERDKARQAAIDARNAEKEKRDIETKAAARRKAFENQITQSLKAAEARFKAEQDAQRKIREDAARGPGSGMEEGSAEAARFMADTANEALAAKLTEKPTRGEEDLIKEAERQFKLLTEQHATQKRQEAKLERLISAVEDNMPQRIRR